MDHRILAFLSALISFQACAPAPTNAPETVNLPHSTVKWQSIGNCWIYATAGWLESLVLRNSGEQLDVSESYLTYRHWETQLLTSLPEELETGGSFSLALSLLDRYGLMREGDFLPEESAEIRSQRQKDALTYINESLRSGRLAELRHTPSSESRRRTVQEELDAAFGVRLRDVERKAVPSSQVFVGKGPSSEPISLHQLAFDPALRWSSMEFPQDWSHRPDLSAPPRSYPLDGRQRAALRRVKAALNDGHPVILSWFVDFHALNGESFSLENLLSSSTMGRQGGHLTVIEDYVASGWDPVARIHFTTPEGEVSDAEKQRALEWGEIDYFIVKNSWGQKPESSFFRDGSYGYHRLMKDYLFAWIPEARDEGSTERIAMSPTLRSFTLPPGY